MFKLKHYLMVIAITMTFSSFSQTIHDLNDKLGRGVNYGNMFEAPSETEWGNPWQPEYPGIIAEMGFNHVRIPIRWEPADRSSATAPYTINGTFLARIKEVIDASLEQDLLVVINMHHHDALFDDPDGQKDRFLSQWQQISAYFKDYSDSLMFELLNEPHGNLNATKWNEFIVDALDVIRVDNPTRAVLIGTPDWGGLGGLPDLVIPDDDNIILTIHYYNPFPFTHQGAGWVDGSDAWLGTEWFDSDLERQVVESEFAYLKDVAEQENIPVHIGEFGAFSTADMASRERWTTFLGRYFEQNGWSWAYWEFSSGFGVYDPATETTLDELVDALLVNEMPEPATWERTTVYSSNFTSNMDGWSLNVSNGANASLQRVDNALNVSINTASSAGWHIQLTRAGINLESGKKYSFSFTGEAADNRPVSFYMGLNSDPWTQYGVLGITASTMSTTYSGVLDMSSDDPAARVVFDLGTNAADLTVTNVLIEELELVLPGEPQNPLSIDDKERIAIYPNPFAQHLFINNTGEYQEARLYNLQGHQVGDISLKPGLNRFDMAPMSKGIYFVRLMGRNQQQVQKIVHQ